MPRKSLITDSTTTGIVLTSAVYSRRVAVQGGVTVANSNPGGIGLYGDSSADWTITNFGSVSGDLEGLRLLSGAVVNYGSISGSRVGIDISSSGHVGARIANNGLISGLYGVLIANSVYGTGAVSARITNDGTISSAGLHSEAVEINGGDITATIANHGSIIGGFLSGIDISASGNASARITNDDTITGGKGGSGVAIGGGGSVVATVVNHGAITAAGSDGGDAVHVLGGGDVSARIVNYGTIAARNNSGVRVLGAGHVSVELTNYGTITNTDGGPGRAGVSIGATASSGNLEASVANDGSIMGSFFGVSFASSGAAQVVNRGVISGRTGIGFTGNYGAATGTVTNSGTIAGTSGTAIQFGSGNERLIANPGAVFVGRIVGGTGTTTLELEKRGPAEGTIGGITAFGRIEEDANASWSLVDSNNLSPSASIDLGKHALLTVAGTLDSDGNLDLSGQGTLSVTAAGSIEIGSSGAPATAGTIQVDSGAALTGTGTINGAFIDDGTIKVTAGVLTLDGDVTGSGMLFIGPDARLTIAGAVGGPGIGFLAGEDETLALGRPDSVLSTISGFGAGDTIDLLGIGKATSANFAAGVLRVTSPGGPVSLNLAGSYTTQNFVLSSDHHGGTNIAWHA
ncbi:MAG: hypothetical protein J0H14_04160 [Alphaproteobacteria bacterium]|nr:hypothetical protein [Alphaproteobacteria bacterium]